MTDIVHYDSREPKFVGRIRKALCGCYPKVLTRTRDKVTCALCLRSLKTLDRNVARGRRRRGS